MEAVQDKTKSQTKPNGVGTRSFFSPAPIQTKLKVNKPGDKYEVEADQVAEQVIQKISVSASDISSTNPRNENNFNPKPSNSPETNAPKTHVSSLIQTQCEACEAKENLQEEEIQRKHEPHVFLKADNSQEYSTLMSKSQTSGSNPVSPHTTSQLFASKGGGKPLPKNTLSEMERGFGVDFSNVRTHTGASAIGMSKSLGAQAFTHGSDIYFDSGKFEPNSQGGKKLLAHELTHVVQQRRSSDFKIQRAIGDGHDLSSPRFARDTELEEVFDGNKVLERGETGGHVNKIQHAIQDKGHFLLHFGIDGEYEGETERGVTAYQREKGISTDPTGKVGTGTMASLDSDFSSVVDNSSTLSQNPADVACIQEILCPWNEAIINDFKTGSRVVILVDDLFWADEIFQGGSWQPHPMPGAGETSGNTIRLNISDDCEKVAQTLYHEYQHARSPRRLRSETWAAEENYAYSIETNWSISRGLTPDPSLVTTDPVSGDTVLDQTGVEAQVDTYPGMGTNEEIIEKVGATRVRVRRDNGTVYVRNAANGDTVPGPRQIVNPRTIRPADWPTCP